MDEQSQAQLVHAYHLIKAGVLTDAEPLVMGVLKQHRDDIDAWWLAAYCAGSLQKRRLALHRVLKLNPEHVPARTLLNRLDVPATKTSEIPEKIVTKKVKHTRRRIKWGYVVFATIGLVLAFSVPLILIDNLTGGKMLRPLEIALLGEPEPLGWVNAAQGGRAQTSVDRDKRIPITKSNRASYGDMKIETLNANEAHRYTFSARRGDELVIAAAFSSNGNIDVAALELWDANGKVLARELRDEGFNFGVLFGTRALQYNVIEPEQLTLVLVSREKGASGNYTLFIDTFEHMMENPPNIPGFGD